MTNFEILMIKLQAAMTRLKGRIKLGYYTKQLEKINNTNFNTYYKTYGVVIWHGCIHPISFKSYYLADIALKDLLPSWMKYEDEESCYSFEDDCKVIAFCHIPCEALEDLDSICYYNDKEYSKNDGCFEKGSLPSVYDILKNK